MGAAHDNVHQCLPECPAALTSFPTRPPISECRRRSGHREGQTVRRGEVSEFFKRLPPCLIGIEACATAHHWARHLMALGHEVKLVAAAYVSPMSIGRRMTRQTRKRPVKRFNVRRCGCTNRRHRPTLDPGDRATCFVSSVRTIAPCSYEDRRDGPADTRVAPFECA